MANDLADPLCRHWFRMGGGDPGNPLDPWGIMISAINATSPTVFTHTLDSGLYTVEFAHDDEDIDYADKMDECNEAADLCVKTLIQQGATLIGGKRELIVEQETITGE